MMLLREAIRLIQSARWSPSRSFAVVASFEPLHLKTYVEAFLVQRVPEDAPRVITFGYDQLDQALQATATTWRASPAALCLSWSDLHPGLSWRGRGPLGPVTEDTIRAQGQGLRQRLATWMAQRQGADTLVVLPPLAWLPLHDACAPMALGPVAVVASEELWRVAAHLTTLGARVLRPVGGSLDYRGLLQSGCPLSLTESEQLAEQLVTFALLSSGTRKKVIVTDLDETLWAGVIGEVGPAGIQCREDGKGMAHVVFQKFLAKLKHEGILLAIVSKNNPDDVLPVFDQLEMPLRVRDFAAIRCNWESKSSNLRAIAQELNLGCDSFILIDDNPAELAQAQAALPEITTLRTPCEGEEWKALFARLQQLCATWRVSEEDRLRAAHVHLMRQRAAATEAAVSAARAQQAGSLQHLQEFALQVMIRREAFADPRSLELINKTNQFNLHGRRFSQEEWLRWAQTPGSWCLSAKLRDRFGDFGTIAVVTGDRERQDILRLRQCVLSCRAFGRGVETLLLGALCRDPEWTWLCGPFTSTGRNEPARRFLVQLGVEFVAGDEWQVSRQRIEADVARVLKDTAAEVLDEARPDVVRASSPAGVLG